MCVPRQDYDGSQKNKPPEPPNYNNYLKKYGEVDFNDPEQFQKYIDDVSEPGKFESSGFAENLSLIPGGIGAIIGFGVSAGQVNNYAELKVAELHAMASGNEELLAMAQAGQKKFLASAGNFVNSGIGKFFAGSGQGALNARYADELKGSGLDLNNIDDWEEEDKKKYARLTGKKTSIASSKSKKITAKQRKNLSDKTSVGNTTFNRSKKVKKNKDLSGKAADKDRQERQKQENIKTSSSNLDKKITSGPNQGKSVREVTGSSFKSKTDKDGKTTYSGGFNAGGLMKRNKIK
jgi:hypothetical protein